MLRKLEVPVVFIVILMALLLVCFAGMTQTVRECNSLISEINEATGENNTVGVETTLLAKPVTNVNGKSFVATAVSNTPLFIAAAVVRSAGGAPFAGDSCPGSGDPAPAGSGRLARFLPPLHDISEEMALTVAQSNRYGGKTLLSYAHSSACHGSFFTETERTETGESQNAELARFQSRLRCINDTVYFKIVPDTPNKLRTNICSPARGEAAQRPSAHLAEGSWAEQIEGRFGTLTYEYGSLYFNIIIVFDTLNEVRDGLLSACSAEKRLPAFASDMPVACHCDSDSLKKSRIIILTCKGQAQTSGAGSDQRPDLQFDVVGAPYSLNPKLTHNNISIRKGQAQTPTAGLDSRPALRFDVVGASASSHTGEFTDEFTAFNNISIRKGQAQTPTAGLDNRPALRFDVVGALSSSRTGEFTDEFTVVNNISIRKGQAQTPTAGLDNRPALRFDVVGALSGNGTEHSAGNINGFRLDIIPIRKGQAQTPTAGMDQRPALRFDVEGALSGVGSGQLSRIIAESAGNGFDASFVYTGKPQAHSAYAGSMPCGVAGARSEAEATFECCPQFADPLNYVNTLGNPITGKVGGAHTDASASYRTYATITHHDANYVSATDVVLIDIESDYFAELRSNLLRVCDDRLLPPSSTVIRDRSDVLDSTDRLALNICPDCFYSGNKISIYSRLPATPTRIPEDQPGLRTGVTVAGNSYGTMMFAVAAAPHRAIETGADCPS